MKKIDTSNWGKFKLGYIMNGTKKMGSGLFEIVASTAYHGKDVVETDAQNGLMYITRSKFNNGLKSRVIDSGNFKINPAGTISFGAENADFFYQTEPYITGNKMYYINTVGLPEYACLFLKSILESTFTANYSFTDGMIPAKIFNESIKLPIDQNGNPDWSYMESYMKNIEASVSDSLTRLQSAKDSEKKKVDTTGWGKFKVGELFDAFLSKDDIQPKSITEGTIPLVSSGKENNGIVAYIEEPRAYLWEGNTLTVDMFGKVFFHEQPYFAVSHGRVNILKPKSAISGGALQFVGCAIEKVTSKKYEFSEMCTGTKLLKDTIMLPVDKNGNPDWAYMEKYMKIVKEKVNGILNCLDRISIRRNSNGI